MLAERKDALRACLALFPVVAGIFFTFLWVGFRDHPDDDCDFDDDDDEEEENDDDDDDKEEEIMMRRRK